MKTQQSSQNQCEIFSIDIPQIYFKITHTNAQIMANIESVMFFGTIKIIFKISQIWCIGIDCTLYYSLQFVFLISLGILHFSFLILFSFVALHFLFIRSSNSYLFYLKTNKLLYLLTKSYQVETPIYHCSVVRAKNMNHTLELCVVLFVRLYGTGIEVHEQQVAWSLSRQKCASF